MLMDIEFIRKLTADKRITATVHAVSRMHERGLMIDDILQLIENDMSQT
ncbi:MAG TPA: hypothetical protein GXX58_05750 [Gelria sp.]|jgi:hypothetical protein|nr:hypothetical protein [Gelria sp.]